MIVYSDGGCLGNGTERGLMYGSFLVDGEGAPHKLSFGFGTNNRAEYLTLIAALEYIKGNHLKDVELVIDSKLVFCQTWGNWGVKNSGLTELNLRARELAKQTAVCARRISGIEMKKILGH